MRVRISPWAPNLRFSERKGRFQRWNRTLFLCPPRKAQYPPKGGQMASDRTEQRPRPGCPRRTSSRTTLEVEVMAIGAAYSVFEREDGEWLYLKLDER